MTAGARRYFHGGAPGLRPGDMLTPRPAGDTRHLVEGCAICDARRAGRPSEYDQNHNFAAVYVTTLRWVAEGFANGYPDGAVYQVEPVGELEIDPEQPPRLQEPTNFAAAAARILVVLDPLVRLTAKQVRHYMRRAGLTDHHVRAALAAR